MPTAKVGDINIYYEIHREGGPLVYISGAGVSSELCTELIPIFPISWRCSQMTLRGYSIPSILVQRMFMVYRLGEA